MKKMQKGGMVKSIIKPFVKKVVKKITKPTTPKMAVGGTTTKRIIKKNTGGMYGIPQENLGTSGQYGFAQKGGTVKKYQKGGYTVTNKDGSPMTTPEGYRPPGVPSYPDFKKLRKTDPGNIAFMQIAKNPEEFDPKDVKKYGAKKPSKRMIREMSKESESAPMQTTPYKKGGATKATKFAALAPPYNKATFADRIVGAKKSAGSKKLPKAQFGAFIKAFSKVVKPVAKIVKPASKVVKPVAKRVATTSKKNIPKEIDFRNTKNSMERMMGSKQIQNYFKKSTQRDNLLNLVNKNKN